MPIREYQCPQCGRFEVIQKFAEGPLTACPTCGKKVTKLISAPAIQFKGSGWYVTDYAKKSSSADKAEPGSSSKESSSSSESKESSSSSNSGSKESSAPAAAKADTSSPSTATSKTSSASGSSSSK